MKNVIGIGAVIAGGYLLYSWLSGSNIFAAAATTSTAADAVSNAAATGSARILGAVLRQQMLNLTNATDNTTYNADTWAYYWNAINGSHGGAIGGDVFDALFVAPYGGDRSKLYTLDQFLAVLSTKGLSGFGKALGNIGLSTSPNVHLTATAYERAYKLNQMN